MLNGNKIQVGLCFMELVARRMK